MMTKTREYCRRWELKHPEKHKMIYTRGNAQKKANGSLRNGHLRRKYGMTPEQWTELFEKQNKQCAICGITEPGIGRYWHVDHNHKTGKIRGILCKPCNWRYLPIVEHQDTLLAKARAYLLVNQ